MTFFLFVSVLAVLGCVAATPFSLQPRQNGNFHLPKSFAAFGDSYSAGIGSGRWLTTSADGRDNPCARETGSYPYQLWQFNPFEESIAWRDFYACSGDKLAQIDGQVQRLGGRKVDVITLSISGNDFGFANVVTKCVYPWGVVGRNFQKDCDDALADAKKAVEDESNWSTYRSKVRLIKSTALNNGGRLYITGYAKFFYPKPSIGDACDGKFFLDFPVIGRKLAMKAANRQTMNDLVDLVNQRIETDVVKHADTADPNLVWMNIDPFFEGFRFCEPANNADPIGSNNPHVWFNDITTNLQETGEWHPDANNAEVAVWNQWSQGMPADVGEGDGLLRPPTDEYQKSSVFHPKSGAHQRTSTAIGFDIMFNSFQNGFDKQDITMGPGKINIGLSPGGGGVCLVVPENCAMRNPLDNTVPPLLCKDGTSPEPKTC